MFYVNKFMNYVDEFIFYIDEINNTTYIWNINEIMIDSYHRINISIIIYKNKKIYDMQRQIQRFKKKRNEIKK